MDQLRRIVGRAFGYSSNNSATRAAADPPQSPPAQLGELQGMPTNRTSSGPAAPQLGHLPVEVLGVIAHKLSEGPLPDAGRDLARLSVTGKALRTGVACDEDARRCLMQAPLVRKAQQIARGFLSGAQRPEAARLCVPVLGLLGPQEQARLTQILLSPANYGPHDMHGPQNAFEDLVPQLADLHPPLRAELAARSASYEDDETAATAIAGFGRGLVHLDEPSRDRLVNKAVSLSDEQFRACAIGYLSAGLERLTTDQRQRLWDAATSIQDERYQGAAIAGLCAQLKHLPPDQRDLLFGRAINLANPSGQATALAGLAAAIEDLDQGQKQTLLTQALGLPDEFNREEVVRALAAGAQHMNPVQRNLLVGAILDLQSADAMAALGTGLAHLTPAHHGQLLAAAASLDGDERITAIAGLATGWQFLEPDRRNEVVVLVLGMDLGNSMAEAIGALGPHLEHLDEGPRNTLAGQACDLLTAIHSGHAIGPDAARALATGLGAGMGALHPDQRGALVVAVAAMSPHRPLGSHNFSNLPAIAAAIAGLAAGQQHLNEPQFQALSRAAFRLEANIDLARNLINYHGSPDATKATAFFSLAKAARTPPS